MNPLSASKIHQPEKINVLIQARLEQDSLVAALKNHDRNAVLRLHENYSASLYGIIRRLVQDDLQAEKVLHLTFERVCSSIEKYNPSALSFFTWINRIARNLSSDELNHQQLINQSSDPKPKSGVTLKIVHACSTPGERVIPQLSDAIEPKYRMILNLVYFQGFSAVEIADQFSLPLQEVKMRLAIAIRQLLNGKNQE